MAQSHNHNLTALALLKFTLYLSKTSTLGYCFITFRILLTVHLLKLSLQSLLPSSRYQSPSNQILKRYDFSPSMALPFNFCTNITVWACLFLSHLHSSSSFLYFSSSRFLAWVGSFLGFLPPFRLNPYLLNPFFFFILQLSSMARTKTTANPPPPRVNYKALYPGPLMSCPSRIGGTILTSQACTNIVPLLGGTTRTFMCSPAPQVSLCVGMRGPTTGSPSSSSTRRSSSALGCACLSLGSSGNS